jgi:hypothetical protein
VCSYKNSRSGPAAGRNIDPCALSVLRCETPNVLSLDFYHGCIGYGLLNRMLE